MTDVAHLQQMLNNLQNQISTLSTMAGQLKVETPAPALAALTQQAQAAAPTDISALVRSAVNAELARRGSVPEAQPAVQVQPAAPIAMPMSTSTPAAATAPPMISNNPAPAPEPPKAEEPKPNMQDMMMQQFMNRLKIAIGGGLTGDQQRWVSANLFSLPDYFKTDAGRQFISNLFTSYKQYIDDTPQT